MQGRPQACLWARDFAAVPEPHFQGSFLQSEGYSSSLRGWDAGFSGLRALLVSVLTPCVQGTGLGGSPRYPLGCPRALHLPGPPDPVYQPEPCGENGVVWPCWQDMWPPGCSGKLGEAIPGHPAPLPAVPLQAPPATSPRAWLTQRWSVGRPPCSPARFRCVQLFVTLWTVARQTLLSVGFFQARIPEWVAISSSRRSS